MNLSEFEPIPLPLEPQIRITGIVPETATLFKVEINILPDASFSLKLRWLDSGCFISFLRASERADARQADLQG